jgi:hypothetical protein
MTLLRLRTSPRDGCGPTIRNAQTCPWGGASPQKAAGHDCVGLLLTTMENGGITERLENCFQRRLGDSVIDLFEEHRTPRLLGLGILLVVREARLVRYRFASHIAARKVIHSQGIIAPRSESP